MKTWVIVGASRGMGKGFVQQALARGDQVYATVRKPDDQTVASLWPEARPTQCHVYACDMLSEGSIHAFAEQLSEVPDLQVDYVVLNAGILQYPNRAIETSYAAFTTHLQTNTIGPIITAQSLLKAQIPIKCLIFISSDSGSAQRFRPEEDGFAVYAASKAALNQTLRHMAAELTRRGSATKVMALHPGEVETDMAANAELSWEVEGVMSVEQSVGKCIRTIEQKAEGESGTFWTWEGEQYPW